MSLGDNVRSGIRWGVSYAAGFSLLALAIAFITVARAGFQHVDAAATVLGKVFAAYFLAGLVSGMLVGVLLPIGRRRIGAALLGLIGGIPVYGVVGMAILPVSEWWPNLAVVTLLCAVTVGPLFGIMVWKDERPR